MLLIEEQLYGLFKQGTQDPKFEDSDKPGMFDLKVFAALTYMHITQTRLCYTQRFFPSFSLSLSTVRKDEIADECGKS